MRDDKDMNKIIKIIEEYLLDRKIYRISAKRINQKHKSYSEIELFGKNGLDDVQEDENDGWE